MADQQPSNDGDNPEQTVVRDIFARALGISPKAVRLSDNLFDIGGHSLIATRIVSAVRRHFRVSFDMTMFYDNATISGVAENLVQCELEDVTPLTRIPGLGIEDLVPASDAQTRLWVEEQMNPGLSRYNAGFQRKLTGALDVEALRMSFIALLYRHEALRTTFEMHDPVLMQRVRSLDQCSPIQFIDLWVCEFRQLNLYLISDFMFCSPRFQGHISATLREKPLRF
jgi:acyl carrier protein